MVKQRIAVLFGGMSSEHEVSRMSATAIISNLCTEKYEIFPIGITKTGNWYWYTGDVSKISDGAWEEDEGNKRAFISPDRGQKSLIVLNEIGYELHELDAVIPVLHGKNGEDGTVQGLLQLSGIPFVGCDLLSSALCMDKISTNTILANAGISKAKFTYILAHNFRQNPEKCIAGIESSLPSYPVFVKPSNAGSSVGVTRVTHRDELQAAIEIAIREDSRILIEEGIGGHEVECAVLGNENPLASVIGEIVPANDFYDYEAKYKSNDSKLYIPANISSDLSQKAQEVAVQAYKLMGCAGLARVDFFIENGTNAVLLNEINTFPGFTSISMYPKLMEKTGIPFKQLLDELINLAIKRC